MRTLKIIMDSAQFLCFKHIANLDFFLTQNLVANFTFYSINLKNIWYNILATTTIIIIIIIIIINVTLTNINDFLNIFIFFF